MLDCSKLRPNMRLKRRRESWPGCWRRGRRKWKTSQVGALRLKTYTNDAFMLHVARTSEPVCHFEIPRLIYIEFVQRRYRREAEVCNTVDSNVTCLSVQRMWSVWMRNWLKPAKSRWSCSSNWITFSPPRRLFRWALHFSHSSSICNHLFGGSWICRRRL